MLNNLCTGGRRFFVEGGNRLNDRRFFVLRDRGFEKTSMRKTCHIILRIFSSTGTQGRLRSVPQISNSLPNNSWKFRLKHSTRNKDSVDFLFSTFIIRVNLDQLWGQFEVIWRSTDLRDPLRYITQVLDTIKIPWKFKHKIVEQNKDSVDFIFFAFIIRVDLHYL